MVSTGCIFFKFNVFVKIDLFYGSEEYDKTYQYGYITINNYYIIVADTAEHKKFLKYYVFKFCSLPI